ncbi:MAG: hypothetical protein JSS68_13455 [Actinobacteria bacterium]|nr:hypothetical protein [Actinomycetota bacterium]
MDSIFTPDNEPYLGRRSLQRFDRIIVLSLRRNEQLAHWSREDGLSDLQVAACQLVPQALKLTLGQRELVRQGYLFAARVLTRAVVERVVTVLYLEANPDGLAIWRRGWQYRDRPRLPAMLKDVSRRHLPFLDAYPDLVEEHNSLTHGDPASAVHNLTFTEDGEPVFGVSKDLDSPEVCDRICEENSLWLGQLMLAADRIMEASAP